MELGSMITLRRSNNLEMYLATEQIDMSKYENVMVARS